MVLIKKKAFPQFRSASDLQFESDCRTSFQTDLCTVHDLFLEMLCQLVCFEHVFRDSCGAISVMMYVFTYSVCVIGLGIISIKYCIIIMIIKSSI